MPTNIYEINMYSTLILLMFPFMLGARVRHSTRGKGHEEGGSTYAKAG